jgi:TPR repeat protein
MIDAMFRFIAALLILFVTNANASPTEEELHARSEGAAAHLRGDYSEAARWFRKAAEQGSASGQTSLGFLYANGQGVPQDYIEAHKWANLAAASGHKNAVLLRDRLASSMTSD